MSDEQKNDELAISLVDAVGPEMESLAKDYAELGLEEITDSDAADKIPIMGTLISVLKIGRGVRDMIMSRKICGFLSGASVSDDKRAKFLLRHADAKGRRRIGESLLLLLERSDDLEKPPLVGALFARFMSEQLTEEELLYATRMLDRIDLADLHALSDVELVADLPSELLWRLSNAGVIDGPKSGGFGSGGFHWNEAAPTRIGGVLLDVFRRRHG